MKTAFIVLLYILSAQTSLQFSTSKGEPRNDGVDQCLPLQTNTSGTCVCNPYFVGSGLIQCEDDPYQLQLERCYCMTFIGSEVFIGPCMYTCSGDGLFYTVNLSVSVCEEYNRQGQMCGSCMAGYAPPVYSYSLSCVNCTTSNWGKFMTVSFLPLTVFFGLIIVFRVNVNNPLLYGPILLMQLVFSPSLLTFIFNRHHYYSRVTRYYLIFWKVISAFFGIWNLDFFRMVYTPFCLSPNTNNLSVLALDYLTAIYPLLLIGITYILVLLHDSNVRVIVCLFKPFIPLFIRFRRQWNIRSSLVDAFATFLLLSCVKILSVSVDLLLPGLLYDIRLKQLHKLYVFNQGDEVYFGNHHFPYACLAIFFLLVFIFLPMMLLLVYPCSCFQVCLNRTGRNCQTLHIFMDSFQGHYKNGRNGTRDFRYFSGLYLLLRVLVYTSLFQAYVSNSYAYTTAIIATFAFITTLANPFKENLSNKCMSFSLYLLLLYSIYYLPHYGINSHDIMRHFNTPGLFIIGAISVVFIAVSFFNLCIPVRVLSDIGQSSILMAKKIFSLCYKSRVSDRDGYRSLEEY